MFWFYRFLYYPCNDDFDDSAILVDKKIYTKTAVFSRKSPRLKAIAHFAIIISHPDFIFKAL